MIGDESYTPGSWRHQDWCPTPSGHEGDCWMENNRVLGIKPIPDDQLPITVIDVAAVIEQHRAGQHLPPIDPHCLDCQDILRYARANHRSHAGYPHLSQEDRERIEANGQTITDVDGWAVIDHSDEECVAAYIFYAQKMSES